MKSFLSLSFLLCLILVGCDSTSVTPTNTDDVAVSKMNLNSEFEKYAVGSTAAKANEDQGKIKVEGERIPLDFFGLNEFDTYEVESEEGEVKGDFSVEVFDPVTGILVEDAAGEITCVTVESDHHTARLGGVVTASNTLPFTIGTFAVWTVVDHGKGGDKTTDLRIGITEEWIRDFHCDIGFPVEAFGGTFQSTSGDIEVEVD